jgi:tight adherence protein C
MIIAFILILLIIIVLYILSKNKYNEYIEPLDKKEYKLKDWMPMGFYVMNKLKYTYSTAYDRKLLNKIAELKGSKYSMYYLQVHWANKIVLLLLILLMLALVGAAMGTVDVSFAVFAVLVLGAIIYFSDNELKEKVKKRRLSIQLDFPDFINKLTLLINAGMTVPKAWEKIVSDNKKDTVLYEELGGVLADIRAGKSEIGAYEDFDKRCRIPEITKFISVILQNMKKGNNEMVSILRLQATECWEMRKNAAKRLGEEASTKMLFPAMIMFLAVLLVVAVPAVLALKGSI